MQTDFVLDAVIGFWTEPAMRRKTAAKHILFKYSIKCTTYNNNLT
jgi:hypothetical protein